MALILKKMYSGYFWAVNDLKDPRSDDYYLLSSQWIPVVIAVVYLYFVHILGPKLMKNRPPFKLDGILLAFNAIQVIVNSCLVYLGTKQMLPMNWFCEPMDYSTTPEAMMNFYLGYAYYLLKISDLFDTIFYVLKKKESHITFLHTYHHAGMVVITYFGARYLAGGHSLYLGVTNCLVHAVMYLYYFLNVFKPELKNSVKWKKYITQLQLIQFVFIFITFGQLLFYPECNYPKIASYFLVPQQIFMICLFSDFYYKAYVKVKSNRKEIEIQHEKVGMMPRAQSENDSHHVKNRF